MKTQITLIADKGNWITNSDLSIIEDRIFTTIITLPDPSLADRYMEVSDEWKNQWEEDHPQPEPEPEGEQ